MGYSANNTDTGALYFGSINPTITGQEVDNDSFMVTSDGTSTGIPISFWKFDEETLLWVQVPNDGNERKLVRTNSTTNIAPTILEIPMPVNGDTATIKLLNNNIEHWNYTNGSWVLVFTQTLAALDSTVDFSVNINPNTVGTTFNPNTPALTTVLYVSTIDGNQWTYNGTSYISEPVSSDWKITGNAGTVQATNFVGTTDNTGLSFRTNNTIRQTITNTGNVGVGITNPLNKLHIGTASIPNTGGVRLPITSASVAQVGGAIGVNINGDIVKIANTTPVTVVDNVNGTVTINAGAGNIQDAQRPIMESSTLVLSSVDTNSDWFDMWDSSAAQMVRVPAMRPSLANYLADGLNDTRTGNIGTTTSGIYAVWNHIHPIIAITAPTPPVIVAGGTGLVIVATTLNSTVTEEECVTFSMTVQCTQTISNAWNTLTVPNIVGYKRPIVTISGMYRNIGNPNLAAGWTNAPSMAIEASNYFNSNTIYLNLPNRTQATEQYISFHIKYVIA